MKGIEYLSPKSIVRSGTEIKADPKPVIDRIAIAMSIIKMQLSRSFLRCPFKYRHFFHNFAATGSRTTFPVVIDIGVTQSRPAPMKAKSMKIVYSKEFEKKYPTNPVENPDRARLSAIELKDYDFIEPAPASLEDISKVHSTEHIQRVINKGIFDAASLAAGGACSAAEIALEGEPSFALIRPPGHHASSTHSWGMCYFNNMAIAVKRIRKRAGKVLIIDIDLHFGDGTASIFRWDPDVKVVNIGAIDLGYDYLKLDSSSYLDEVSAAIDQHEYNIVGVSAGFDTYIEDWGGLLTQKDFHNIGKIIREGAERNCAGRRFAILEGGYHEDLRLNIKNFIRGFE